MNLRSLTLRFLEYILNLFNGLNIGKKHVFSFLCTKHFETELS